MDFSRPKINQSQLATMYKYKEEIKANVYKVCKKYFTDDVRVYAVHHESSYWDIRVEYAYGNSIKGFTYQMNDATACHDFALKEKTEYEIQNHLDYRGAISIEQVKKVLKGENDMKKDQSIADINFQETKYNIEQDAASRKVEIDAEAARAIKEAQEKKEEEELIEQQQKAARACWVFYTELKNCGFTDEQAMAILLEKI